MVEVGVDITTRERERDGGEPDFVVKSIRARELKAVT